MGYDEDSTPAVPYDAEVEYLESTATQYIDTGVIVVNPATILIECDADYGPVSLGIIHNNASSGTWLGARKTSSTGGDLYSGSYSGRKSFLVTSERHTYAWDGAAGYSVDGVFKASFTAVVGSDAISTISWPLFACYDFYGPAYRSQSVNRFYSARIHVSGTLSRDFIPVRVGYVGYLYDRANPTGGPLGNGLYPNAGTGSFRIGPDVS